MIYTALKSILLALVTVVIFGFLLVRVQGIDYKQHNDFTSYLRRVKELNATLNQDVIKSRYGLLTYYDPLANELSELNKLQNRLGRIPTFVEPRGQIEIKQSLQAQGKLLQEKEKLVERFKSQNATLRNSLYYFPQLILETTQKATKNDWNLEIYLENLLRDILIYNLTASEDLAPKIQVRMNSIFAYRSQSSNIKPDDINRIILHGKTILSNKPQVDNLIQTIVSLPTFQRNEELYKIYNLYYETALKTTNAYRSFLGIFSLFLIASISAYIIDKLKKSAQVVSLAKEKVQKALEETQVAQEKVEVLLLNILPEPIAQRLKQNPGLIADNFSDVTVLFADLVGFTEFSADMSPVDLVELLNNIFSVFDKLAEKHGLEKIKTIGDAYMVVGGIPVPVTHHAEAIAEMALDIQGEITKFHLRDSVTINARIGINSGSAVAGVIGTKKFIYDIWGDTVNIASRMESQGISGKIQVTTATYALLKDKYLFEERGTIKVKGKGDMNTYFLTGRRMTKNLSLEL
jgi:class 3 adenylate cyclase